MGFDSADDWSVTSAGCGGALFLFFYPSSGDTFRFPALSACCSGELRARGITSRVAEIWLDVSDDAARAAALVELGGYLARTAPAVVIAEDVFEPRVFGVIRESCGATVVFPGSPDDHSRVDVDYVVGRFETNPRPLIDLVERLVRGVDPVGLPNVSRPGGAVAISGPGCAATPMFEAVPDYDFVRIPAGTPRPSSRLSVYVNPGCPWAADAARNPVYSGVDLSGGGLATHGCSFCLQDGEYSALDAESSVDRTLLELAAWRKFNPGCDELVLWDESPWRYLPALVERLAADGAGPLTICFHARCDHLVKQAQVVVEACRAARRHPRSGVGVAITLIGFENYSQAELDRMNKGYDAADLSAAAAACRRIADEYPEVFEFDRFQASSFILFTPWTGVDDLRANIAGFKRDAISEFSTGMGRTKLRLYPNLPICRLAMGDGLIAPGAFDDELNASRRFGYSSDVPWIFRDRRIEQVFRLHEALYPLVERNEQTDLLEWCVDAVFDGDAGPMDAKDAARLFVRLAAAVRKLNADGSGTGGAGPSPGIDARGAGGHARTLEIFLSGHGVPDGRSQPDLACDPSPGRLAVKISRMAGMVERVHILGREPSLSPIFLRAVYLARQAGVPRATVRTDGLVFADPAALAKAIKAGVTEIEMRVFGADNGSWQRATSGRGDISRFRKAAALVGASSSAVRGRALVELGMVNPASVPVVLEMVAATGLPRVSYECPVALLPRVGLSDFVFSVEALAG